MRGCCGELPQSKPDGFASSLWEGAFGIVVKLPVTTPPVKKQSGKIRRFSRSANYKISFPLRMPSNDDDRRQWRNQGGVVGAAASKTQVPPKARSGCWVPQPVRSGAHSKSSVPRHCRAAAHHLHAAGTFPVWKTAIFPAFSTQKNGSGPVLKTWGQPFQIGEK